MGVRLLSHVAETLGWFLGAVVTALIIALPVAGILSAFKQRFGRSWARGYSIVVVGISLLGLVGGMLADKYAARRAKAASDKAAASQMIDGLLSDINKVASDTVDGDGLPKPSSLKFEGNTETGNDFERVRGVIQSYLNDQLTLQNDYIAALDKAGLNELLVPDRVWRDSDFSESRRILIDVREVIQQYRDKSEFNISSFSDKVDQANFTPAIKASLANGFEKGLSKTIPLLREIWDLEAAVADCMEEMLEHLRGTRGRWAVSEGQFVFERQSDIDKYNEILGRLQGHAQRQLDIKQRCMQSSQQSFNSLKAEMK